MDPVDANRVPHKLNTFPGRTFSEIAVFNPSGLVNEGKHNEIAEWFRFRFDRDVHGVMSLVS